MAAEPAPLEVVAGILSDPRGRVLIAERPAGKAHAGRWEFPGGKRHADEAPRAALARELAEELGITVEDARPLLRVTHRYPNAARAVSIDAWSVGAWSGEPSALDGQRLRWCERDALLEAELLEADRPIVVALWLPARFVQVAAAALRADDRAAAGERTAWIVGQAPDRGTEARLGAGGEPQFVLDPVEPPSSVATGALYSHPSRLRGARSRVPLGCVVCRAAEAREARARGADFLLVRGGALTATDLAGIASLGLPWYLDETVGPGPEAPPATGRVRWGPA